MNTNSSETSSNPVTAPPANIAADSSQASSANQTEIETTTTGLQTDAAELTSSFVAGAGTTATEQTTGTLSANDALVSQNPPELLLSPFSDEISHVIQLLDIGGPVVWILLVLSVFALSIVLLKLWQFALLRPESIQDVNQALEKWQKGEQEAAINVLNAKRPVSRVVAVAMRGITQEKEHNTLQDELSRQANEFMHQLRSLFRPLEVIASLSPLLGLMGTVLGMIVAFQQMEAAGNQVDPSVLSGGIWQALLTTAVGLAVAIPVAAAHSWLDRKAERVAHLLNDSVTQVFTSSMPHPPASVSTGVSNCAA